MKRAFGDDFVERVKLLSDSLDLNEVTCADLLWKAESSKVRYGSSNLLEIAESIFFDARVATLKTLQMLFTARQNAAHAGQAGLLIAQFTTELLDGGLFIRLLDTIASYLSVEEKEIASSGPARTGAAPPPAAVSNAQWDHQRTERHMVAEIIFTICYTTVISDVQAIALLKLLQQVALRCSSAGGDVMQSHGLYHTCFTLLASLIVVLDVCNEHEVLDIRGDKTRPALIHDTQFILNFHALIQSKWAESDENKLASGETLHSSSSGAFGIPVAHCAIAIHSITKMAWASFIRQTFRVRRSDPALTPAHQLFREENIDQLLKNLSPAFRFLTGALQSELLENDKSYHTVYIEVVDELVRSFLTTSGLKAREMKSEEENGMRAEAAYQQYKVGPKPPKFTREFDHFLRLIAALYQRQPALASRYWNEDFPALAYFVRGAGDNLFESNFVSYLKMLASLASGPECAQFTFRFLHERSRKYTNWDYFFDALHQYYLDFQEPQDTESSYYDYSGRVPPSRVIRQISPDEVENLEAILLVMQSVLKYSQQVRAEMLANSQWRVLDALFHLLTCPVPVSLKASLTNTINEFARDPSVHILIWTYLDAIQLISSVPTVDATKKAGGSASSKTGSSTITGVGAQGIISGGGILFELSEIESKEERYPYTLAFVKLLNTLLTNHYYQSRDTLADVNLWPYTQFVMKDVFQRFDQRAYKNRQEKWHIAKACLQFFLHLLRDSVDAFSFSEQTFSQSSYLSKMDPNNAAAASGRGQSSNSGTSADAVSMAAQLAVARYGSSTLRLYRYFLSRTELLNKVIAIICAPGQADLLITTREQNSDSAVEDCVRFSLMILETVLLRQGPILSSHFPNFAMSEDAIIGGGGTPATTTRRLRIPDENTSILVPLHTILLRQPSDLASLALYVRYPFSSSIARLSVSIVHLLSRDTDKLALILHDQGVVAHFVNGFIDKLETQDSPSRNRDQVHYRGLDNYSSLSIISDSSGGALIEDEEDEDSQYWASRAPSIREAILSLLLECATQPEYNLTQLLFGMGPSESSRISHHSSYSFNRHIERSSGGKKSDSPLSVLPTMLALLGERSFSASQPKLCAMMYELLYALLQRPTEFGGVCRSLRSGEFFQRQLNVLDVSLSSASVANQIIFASEQQSLLLPSQSGSHAAAGAEETQAQAAQQLEQELYGPLMEQRAWLLKSIALELHTTCGTNRTYATHLLEALFTTQLPGSFPDGLRPTTVDNPGKKRLTSANNAQDNATNAAAWNDNSMQQQRMKMRELLDALEIPLIEPLPIIQGSVYFGKQSSPIDMTARSIDLARCTELERGGFSSVDLRLLYGQLVAAETEVRNEYTLSQEQSSDMIAEQTVILRRAVAWNRFQQVLRSQYEILESWRQVLEVTLLECYHLLDTNSKEIALYELLETLLLRLTHPELRLQIGHPLTSCILMLTAKIRQLTFPVHLAKLKSIEDSLADSSLEPSATGAASSAIALARRPSPLTEELLSTASPSYLPVEQLLSIHRLLCAALLRQGSTLSMRGNLYGSLLNYLQFTQRSSAEVILIASNNSFGDFWTSDEDSAPASFTQQQQQQRQLYLGTLRQLHATAERLMEVIAADATDAPHLHRSLALGTLDALCTYEGGLYALCGIGGSYGGTSSLISGAASSASGGVFSAKSASVGAKWLSYLTRQGLLRFFLESLVQHDDGALADILLPTVDSLNDLYVFESKMAMLLSMATSSSGAEALVEAGLFSQLVQFSCIDHPHQAFVASDAQAMMDTSSVQSWMRPVHERYDSILLPVLRLVVSVLSQMPRNADVAAQAVDFVEAHAELISLLLKDRGPAPTRASLQQLSLLATLFYHLALHDTLLFTRLQVQASKFHLLLTQLFAKYTDRINSPSDVLLPGGGSSASSSNGPSSGAVAPSGSSSSSSRAVGAIVRDTFTEEADAIRTQIIALVRTLSSLLQRLSVASSSQVASSTSSSSSPAPSSPVSQNSGSPTSVTSTTAANQKSEISALSKPASQNLEVALQRPGKILFVPSMASATTNVTGGRVTSSYTPSKSARRNGGSHSAASSGRDQPPLSALVHCIHASLARLEITHHDVVATIKKLQSVHQCKTEELVSAIRVTSSSVNGVFGLDVDVDSLSVDKATTLQLQQAVQHILGAKLADHRIRITTLYQIIENALFVLWRHLSHFLAEEDVNSNAHHTSTFILNGAGRANKVDTSALQKDSTNALDTLYSKLEALPSLSMHQTHIIPALLQRLKDILGVL